MYTIDKDVPMPKRRANEASVTACLQNMKVGDSVLIDNRHKCSFYQSANRSYKNPNGTVKISIRQVGQGTSRVWRIE